MMVNILSPAAPKKDILSEDILKIHWVDILIPMLVSEYGYGSIPINTIFRGMNIHLPAILGFTRGTRVLTHPHINE